jgi:carbonic anhydrase
MSSSPFDSAISGKCVLVTETGMEPLQLLGRVGKASFVIAGSRRDFCPESLNPYEFWAPHSALVPRWFCVFAPIEWVLPCVGFKSVCRTTPAIPTRWRGSNRRSSWRARSARRKNAACCRLLDEVRLTHVCRAAPKYALPWGLAITSRLSRRAPTICATSIKWRWWPVMDFVTRNEPAGFVTDTIVQWSDLHAHGLVATMAADSAVFVSIQSRINLEFPMSIIDKAVKANRGYAKRHDPKLGERPAPIIAVVTCMDPRLSNLPDILGLPHADIDVIRTGGPAVTDDVLGELVVSTRVLGTREILLLNHTGCGFTTFTDHELNTRLAAETGDSSPAPMRFFSYKDPEENTREQISKIRSHPWISKNIPVRGFVFDMETGLLSEVEVEAPVAA